jgi:selenoprotein W-related protein
LAEQLLGERGLEVYIGSLELIPGKGGVFEVNVNGELLYSKKATGRHAEPGEVQALVKRKLAEVRGANGS